MSLSQNVFIRLVSLHARGAVMSLIFLKSVRLSNAAREKMAIGQVVNLMANDRRVTTITTTTHTAHMAATTHPLRAGRPAGCSDSCAGVVRAATD